jgi:hypothetical protein
MPTGGYRALTTKKRLAATAAAYGAMTAKMLSGANRQRRRGSYGVKPRGVKSVSTGKPRGRPRKTATITTVIQESASTAPTPIVRSTRASAKQLEALAKARASRAANRGDYVVLPPGGTRALTTKKRLAATAAAYGAMSANMLSGGNKARALAPYGISQGPMFAYGEYF